MAPVGSSLQASLSLYPGAHGYSSELEVKALRLVLLSARMDRHTRPHPLVALVAAHSPTVPLAPYSWVLMRSWPSRSHPYQASSRPFCLELRVC